MESSAVVLAGGFSSRFGQDKVLLPLNGRPLIRHVVDAVQPIVDEVIIVTSSPERAELYAGVVGQDVKFALDQQEAQGPLVGALSGFEAACGTYSLLLAADMPLLSREVLKLFLDLCHGKAAVIPRWPNQQIEPLHAAYHTKLALEAARLAVAEGAFTVWAMIDRLRGVRYVSTLAIQQLDSELRTFFNVNTPLDLKMAEGLLKKGFKSEKRRRF